MTTATELPCYTFEARSLLDGTTQWVCVARRWHNGELWHTRGIGSSRGEARADCVVALKEVEVTAPRLFECDDPQDQRALLGAALNDCRMLGFPIEPVDPPYSGIARGNGDGVPR